MTDPEAFLPLAPTQFHVLVSLTAGERHGYAIMKDVETMSERRVRMGPATLYGTLKRLVDNGLVEEVERDQAVPGEDQRRRYYRLTTLGERVCGAEADRLANLVRLTRVNLGPAVG